MLITEYVSVKWNPSNRKRYENLGYPFTKYKDDVLIKTVDLSPTSRIKVNVQCDYCGEKTEKAFRDFLDGRKIVSKDCCEKCRYVKGKESIKITYGVDTIWEIEGFKEKLEQSNLEKYGEKYHFLTEESKENIKNITLEKYGVEHYSQTEEFKEKYESTCLEKYGVKRPSSNENVKEKKRQTMIDRYGVDNPMKVLEFKEKLMFTLYENQTAPCSKQQKHIHELLGGELNLPVNGYYLDIAFPNEKIYVEYDGSGHDLQVKFGSETEDEFEKRNIKRYFILKRLGWKMIRIISVKDKLPNDLLLTELLNSYFAMLIENNLNWINLDIDENKEITKYSTKNIQLGKLKYIS